ncbi:unnamed protein product [Lupinus luteus]|uniref:Uncharacterized protein n=1 Tax=Lupinus luteus TaxID=3873 RepID=A0AAV1YGI4_LUPLU
MVLCYGTGIAVLHWSKSSKMACSGVDGHHSTNEQRFHRPKCRLEPPPIRLAVEP